MRRKDLMLKLAQTLEQRRATIRKTFAEHTMMIAVDDRSVGDSADAALDGEQDELDSQLAAVESRELAAIDTALVRIRTGRYGVCDRCGKKISTARLQALPYATLCIKCRREEEQFGRGEAAGLHWERLTDTDDEHTRSSRLHLELA